MTRIRSTVPRTASNDVPAQLRSSLDKGLARTGSPAVLSVELSPAAFTRSTYFGLVGTYDWYPATVSAGDAAIIRREDWRRAQLLADLPDNCDE